MNTQDAKRVLETALICANQPLPLRAMRSLFDDQIGDGHAAHDARRTRARLGRQRRRAGRPRVGLALPEPPGAARVPRPAASREAAEVLACRAGNAGHHCLPPAGHARRHRGHPRRHGHEPDRQAARGSRLDRGHRPPRGAGPPGAVRDHAPVPRRPGPGQPRPVARARGRPGPTDALADLQPSLLGEMQGSLELAPTLDDGSPGDEAANDGQVLALDGADAEPVVAEAAEAPEAVEPSAEPRRRHRRPGRRPTPRPRLRSRHARRGGRPTRGARIDAADRTHAGPRRGRSGGAPGRRHRGGHRGRPGACRPAGPHESHPPIPRRHRRPRRRPTNMRPHLPARPNLPKIT